MITTKKLLTTVEFAKTVENGSLAIGCIENTLIIQQLIAPQTVGKQLKEDEIKELPKIEMNFYTKESIDIVIDKLKKIKEYIDFPYGTLGLAC